MPIKNIPPGEWKLTLIDPNSTFETMGYFIRIADNTTAISSYILQKDYPQAEYSQQEIEAIGKLLHAAPKLYEALNSIINHEDSFEWNDVHNGFGGDFEGSETSDILKTLLSQAKEALKLANS